MDIGQSNLSVLKGNITKSNLDIEVEKNMITKKSMGLLVQIATKRGIDVIASVIGIILLLPITLFVAICNMIKGDRGPIFFVQERIGKNGKLFRMYKFRTMIVNAEEILQRHMQENTEIGKEYRENKKIKNDPRITKIGAFLRRTSIDEFPQFINVLKGTMSLVGPRPYLSIEKKDMGEYYNIIIKMKPGITGPWQVSGRNNMDFQDRLKIDVAYYKEKALVKDIKIAIKTIASVINKEGAM